MTVSTGCAYVKLSCSADLFNVLFALEDSGGSALGGKCPFLERSVAHTSRGLSVGVTACPGVKGSGRGEGGRGQSIYVRLVGESVGCVCVVCGCIWNVCRDDSYAHSLSRLWFVIQSLDNGMAGVTAE